MPTIDTPLLIIGAGPAALVAAKVVSGQGLGCLVAGHEPFQDEEPVELDQRSLAVLEPHGVLDVLRPYASVQTPFTIAPMLFEQALKHHCVADMLITVYDGMSLVDDERTHATPTGILGVLTDGKTRWGLTADAFFDTADLAEPTVTGDRGDTDLNRSIDLAAGFAERLLAERA